MKQNFRSQTVGIIGGDRRISLLASIMKDNGYKVKGFALAYEDQLPSDAVCSSIEEIFNLCDIIILPIPVSRDKICLFCEKQGFEIKLDSIVPSSECYGKKLILGGLIPKAYAEAMRAQGHTIIDFYENQKLIQNNAIATAEGALMIAMEKSDTTVVSSEFGIMGFGRIAFHLAKIISSLGGKVTVFARSDKAIAEAAALSYKTFMLEENGTAEYSKNLADALDSLSIVFNTIPSIKIDKNIISNMTSRPLYIELASYPYGINSKDAREMNFNTVYAPSLPGRYCPFSAAEYIFEAISYYLTQI